MFGHFQQGKPLDDLRSARNLNAIRQSVLDGQQRPPRPERQPPPPSRDFDVITLRNDSGGDRERFEILAIGAPLVSPVDDEPHGVAVRAHAGLTPCDEHRGRWALLLEPINDGRIGRALVSGVEWAKVDFPGEAGYSFADISEESTDGGPYTLRANAEGIGSAQVLWKEPGTGVRWARIRISNHPGAGLSSCPTTTITSESISSTSTATTSETSESATTTDGTTEGTTEGTTTDGSTEGTTTDGTTDGTTSATTSGGTSESTTSATSESTTDATTSGSTSDDTTSGSTSDDTTSRSTSDITSSSTTESTTSASTSGSTSGTDSTSGSTSGTTSDTSESTSGTTSSGTSESTTPATSSSSSSGDDGCLVYAPTMTIDNDSCTLTIPVMRLRIVNHKLVCEDAGSDSLPIDCCQCDATSGSGSASTSASVSQSLGGE